MHSEYVEQCGTVDGAIEVVLPAAYLTKILVILNENRFCFFPRFMIFLSVTTLLQRE